MELGCFLAGSIVSAIDSPVTSNVESLVNPIKDFFASIFFAAIGTCENCAGGK